MLRSGQGCHQLEGPTPNVAPLRSPMLVGRNADPYGMPPAPWMGDHGHRPPGSVRGGYGDVSSGPIGEPSEFSLKILCSTSKIRAVIGRGGCNVKQLEQETGASIHVEDASTSQDDERIIRVSAVEVCHLVHMIVSYFLHLCSNTLSNSRHVSIMNFLLLNRNSYLRVI